MNTPAQVTEAHKRLVATIVERAFRFAEGNHKITPELGKLIADSEAKACDQLRAEVERLKRDYDYDHKCLYEVRERCELWKQRAERAELRIKQLEETK